MIVIWKNYLPYNSKYSPPISPRKNHNSCWSVPKNPSNHSHGKCLIPSELH